MGYSACPLTPPGLQSALADDPVPVLPLRSYPLPPVFPLLMVDFEAGSEFAAAVKADSEALLDA